MNEDISKSVLEVLSHLGIEARSYSGRGMYGKSCIGVDCGRGEAFQVVAKVVLGLTNLKDADEEAAEHFTLDGSVATDSMGMGSIVYFPRLPWLMLCDDVHDEDEECDGGQDCGGEGCDEPNCADCG